MKMVAIVNKERFTGLQPTKEKEKKYPAALEVMEGYKNWFPDRWRFTRLRFKQPAVIFPDIRVGICLPVRSQEDFKRKSEILCLNNTKIYCP